MNFLLIMTDQQRGDCLGIDGHPCLLTPTMDAIAGAGARFTHAYSSCPVCIPARRSLLSGQFPATHGLVGYQDGVDWQPSHTLPGVLRDAGYQTHIVGRGMHQHPPRKRFGYESMVIQDHGIAGDYGDYQEWLARHEPPGSGGYYGSGVMHNDWTARPWHMADGLHHTHWTVNQALEFLRKRDPSSPYFLTVSFLAPHPPLTPPQFYFDRYLRMTLPPPVIGSWAAPPPNHGLGMGASSSRVVLEGEALRACQAGYFGLINHIDDQIHRLLNEVTGVNLEETVVIFTSDHGEMLGDHFRFRKSLPYEGAARIPLLLRAPSSIGVEPGTVNASAVCLEDIMPTVLEMAGLPVPDSVEGHSLLPALRGESELKREYVHLEHAGSFHALTDGREKYIWHTADGAEQFFNLNSDPRECRDLIADAGMGTQVHRWRRRLIETLASRPEGFTDGKHLLPGRPYPPVLHR